MKRTRKLPLVYRWNRESEPLPVKAVRAARGRSVFGEFAGQPWIDTGPRDRPLDFTASVRRLVEDIAQRHPEWAHLQPDRLLIGFTQAKSRSVHGLQARVTPLRFEGGQLQRRHDGFFYQIQRYCHGNVEFLYLLTFCLPRFLDQDFDHKMLTLFHELYHIGEKFDGDLRRQPGRYHLHSHSKHDYDRWAAEFARRYLAGHPDPRLTAFLRLNFRQLSERHGQVVGVCVPRPKIIPLPSQANRAAAHADEISVEMRSD